MEQKEIQDRKVTKVILVYLGVKGFRGKWSVDIAIIIGNMAQL